MHHTSNTEGTVDELMQQYDTNISDIINQHAPLICRMQRTHTNSPWYTEAIREAKKKRRSLERTWRRSKKETHRNAYRCIRMSEEAKTIYYTDKIMSCHDDQKQLFKITNHLLEDQHIVKLPQHISDLDLVNGPLPRQYSKAPRRLYAQLQFS